MTTDDIDLAAYLRRIGFDAAPRPDLATLNELARRHAAAIPFENLSPLMGAGVPLDMPSIERKLVLDRRGGYCFEQNRLFAAALQRVGFEVECLAARVMWNRPPDAVAPRTHMLLTVRLDGTPHVVDVGFGGLTLTGALRLQGGVEQPTAHEPFRLVELDGSWRMEAQLRGQWRPLYAFDLQPQHAVDCEAPNWYMSTHPQSPFVNHLVCALALPDRRLALMNRQFSVHSLQGETRTRVLQTSAELLDVLRDEFGIGGLEGEARLLQRLDALA